MTLCIDMSEKQLFELLLEGVSHDQAVVRLDAVMQLGFRQAAAVSPHLLRAVSDEDHRVRCEAIRALGRLRVREARDLLIVRLFDEVPRVRVQIIKALGMIAGRDTCATFIAALSDSDASVRHCAARMLRRWSTMADMPQLQVAFAMARANLLPMLHRILFHLGDPQLLALCLARLDPQDESICVTLLDLLPQHSADQLMIDHLLPLLHASHRVIRCHTARTLGLLAHRSVLEPLLQACHDSDKDVQYEAVLALMKWEQEPQVRAVLRDLVSQNIPWETRLPAFITLGDEQDIQSILASLFLENEALTGSRLFSIYKQLRIVEAAIQRGNAAVISSLLALARQNIHPAFRFPIMTILGRLRTVEAVERLHQIAMEGSTDAIRVLQDIGDPQCFTALLDVVQRCIDMHACVRAVEALGKSSDERASLSLVMIARTHQREEIRYRALKALARWIDQLPVQQTMIEALRSTESGSLTWTGRVALSFLQSAPINKSLLNQMEKLLHHDQWGIRCAALQIVSNREGEQVLSLIEKGLSDPIEQVRQEAILALKPGPAVVPHLVQALKDASRNVSTQAANLLGLIGDQQAVVPLIQALSTHRGDSVLMLYRRKAAAEASGRLGNIHAVPALIKAAQHDPNQAVGAAAIVALWRIQDEKSIPLIKEIFMHRQDCQEVAAFTWVKETLNQYMPLPQKHWSLLIALTIDLVFCLTKGYCHFPNDAFLRERLLYQLSQPAPFSNHSADGRIVSSEVLSCNIARTSGFMREIRSVPLLITWLDLYQEEKQRLIDALEALTRIGDVRAIPSARALLQHKHPHVRYAARKTLRALGI